MQDAQRHEEPEQVERPGEGTAKSSGIGWRETEHDKRVEPAVDLRDRDRDACRGDRPINRRNGRLATTQRRTTRTPAMAKRTAQAMSTQATRTKARSLSRSRAGEVRAPRDQPDDGPERRTPSRAQRGSPVPRDAPASAPGNDSPIRTSTRSK